MMLTRGIATIALAGMLAVTVPAPEVGEAQLSTWEKKTVLLDHSSDGWEQLNRDAVEDYNAVRPKGMPRLIYRDAGYVPCEELRGKRKPGRVTVCSKPTLGYYAYANVIQHRSEIRKGIIVLADDTLHDGPENTIRHEIMHAMTWVNDRTGNDPESVVWGLSPTFGATDVRIMRKAVRRAS